MAKPLGVMELLTMSLALLGNSTCSALMINGFAEVLVVYGYAPVIRFILLIKHRFKIKAEIEGIVGLLYRGGNKLGRVLIAHPFALIKK